MDKVSENEVLEVIKNALNIKGGGLTLESSIEDVEEWDSLGHLGILSALDKFFEGKIASIKEIAAVDSIQKILRILKNNSLI